MIQSPILGVSSTGASSIGASSTGELIMRRWLTTVVMAAWVLLSITGPLQAGTALLDDFDAPGSTMSGSELSKQVLSGDGTFVRQPLAAATAAPDTAPALLINVGGDQELRYFEQSFAPTRSYAVTPDVLDRQYIDVMVDAYVGIGYAASFGSRSAALLARFSGTSISTVNAYAATVTHVSSQTHLSLQRITNGVGSVLASSDAFAFDPANEHLRLQFSVVGAQLAVTAWRIHVVAGVVVETAVDLDSATPNVQSTLTATDTGLTSGSVGVQAFARGGNSVFFEAFAAQEVPSFSEQFDAPGSDMAASEFSTLITSGGGTYTRQPLAASTAAPETVPPLPINVGGDQELRYWEQTLAPTGSYAVTPDIPSRHYADLRIDGYVGIGYTSTFGGRAASFLARFSGSTIRTVNAYAATISQGGSSATLRLQRIDNGILRTLASSTAFPFDPANEHLRLTFTVVGSDLEFKAWRVNEVGGAVVETELDLDTTTTGVQSTLQASDTTLTSGRVGLRSFARRSNSIFYDEIAVFDLAP